MMKLTLECKCGEVEEFNVMILGMEKFLLSGYPDGSQYFECRNCKEKLDF